MVPSGSRTKLAASSCLHLEGVTVLVRLAAAPAGSMQASSHNPTKMAVICVARRMLVFLWVIRNFEESANSRLPPPACMLQGHSRERPPVDLRGAGSYFLFGGGLARRYGNPPLIFGSSAQIFGSKPSGRPDWSSSVVRPVMPGSFFGVPAPREGSVMPGRRVPIRRGNAASQLSAEAVEDSRRPQRKLMRASRTFRPIYFNAFARGHCVHREPFAPSALSFFYTRKHPCGRAFRRTLRRRSHRPCSSCGGFRANPA